MKVYKALPAYEEEQYKKMKRVLGKSCIFSTMIAIVLLIYELNHFGLDIHRILLVCMIMIPMLLIVSLFSIKYVLKRLKKSWGTYELIIEEQGITKKQDQPTFSFSFMNNSMYGDIYIFKQDMKSLKENEDGLMVGSLTNVIFIPRLIEGYDEIKEILNQWMRLN